MSTRDSLLIKIPNVIDTYIVHLGKDHMHIRPEEELSALFSVCDQINIYPVVHG